MHDEMRRSSNSSMTPADSSRANTSWLSVRQICLACQVNVSDCDLGIKATDQRAVCTNAYARVIVYLPKVAPSIMNYTEDVNS